jgi:hypothetical protein
MAAIHEHSLALGDLGIETRVLEAGAGPTVVMLHGNPGNADECLPSSKGCVGHPPVRDRSLHLS